MQSRGRSRRPLGRRALPTDTSVRGWPRSDAARQTSTAALLTSLSEPFAELEGERSRVRRLSLARALTGEEDERHHLRSPPSWLHV